MEVTRRLDKEFELHSKIVEHESFDYSSPGSASDSEEDSARTFVFSSPQFLLLLSESLKKEKLPGSLPSLPTSPQNFFADALDNSSSANPAVKLSSFKWLSPRRTTFSNIASSTPIIHLDEDEVADQDSEQEASSQDFEHVPDFEPSVAEEEDIDNVREEDILDPFWAVPISRAGTFESAASQDDAVSRRFFGNPNSLKNQKQYCTEPT
ncbi:hypothetical protein R1flu_005755 [Riccia fluitans]|uniref:Uncharacterized protein n=1 Tax=Riccia fluitans TaxID=41844 RepID=A0ABD1YU31_9MARC